MKTLIISSLVVSIFILSFGVSNAQEFLVVADEVCIQGPPGSSGAVLYRVDPDTAAFQEIGPIGFDGVGALAQIGDGRLIAGGKINVPGNPTSILIEINPNTGRGTLIGNSGSAEGPGCGRINDLTYDPSTDTLYATGIQCDTDNGPNNDFDVRLLTINPNTGTQTIIGETGFILSGNALAIDGNGSLFSSGGCNNVLYTIDPLTGVGTFVTDVDEGCSSLFNSATFSPLTGELLGTFNGFPTTELAVIQTDTGDVSVIGQLPDCADGITFFEREPRPIPTLSQWGLIAMAGVLGIIGFVAIRKKYAIP